MRAFVWLTLMAVGCGKVLDEPLDALPDAAADAGDMTAPQVVALSPVDGASEVAQDTTVSIVFDEPIAPSTLTMASFSIADDRGTAIAGTIATMPTGATFTPAAPLVVDRTYTATVTTAVTDLAGHPLASNISWSFAPRRRAWGSAGVIEADNAGPADNARVAVDPAGNAVAVWQQSDGTVTNVWASRFVVDTGWQPPVLLENDNAGYAQSPQVAFDAAGNATVVWNQFDGTRANIVASRLEAGIGWRTAQPIENASGDAYNPQLAVDASGNAIAAWEQYDGVRTNLWASRYTAGGGWSMPSLVETNDAGDANSPHVAIDASGNAIAVWRQSDGTRHSIWGNRFVAGTGWSTATLIETDDAGDAHEPRVALDAAGNAFAVWYQHDGTHFDVWANRFVVGTGWMGAMQLETDAGDAIGPRIAVDAAGNATVVWAQSDGTRFNVWARRFVAGTGWSVATLLETDNTSDAGGGQIAVDADGNVVAVWMQSDGTRFNIVANRFLRGAGWQAAALIETDNAGHGIAPEVAFDAAGNAIAVWTQSDGTRTNVVANTLR